MVATHGTVIKITLPYKNSSKKSIVQFKARFYIKNESKYSLLTYYHIIIVRHLKLNQINNIV
jgi:hypothetical protein